MIVNEKLLFTELQMAFNAFDNDKKGCISTDMIGTILAMLGHELDEATLRELIDEVDIFGENIREHVSNLVDN